MSRETLPSYAEAAARAARAAGALLAQYVGRPKQVATKRSAIDLVTEVDRAAERLLHARLHRAFPQVGFLGEEHGARGDTAAGRWIVDPLDGTNNFVHGLPLFGVSIGLEQRGRIVVGVIYDPMRRELFVALKGRGAFLNGRRLRVSATRTLARSLLSTGFSTTFLRQDQPYLGWFRAVQRHSHGVRRLGSTVLSLAAVAAGRLEGFYERDLWPWDMAAGMLLVEEAGGRVSNLAGRRPRLASGELVATNGRIHHQLLRTLARAGSR
jgi:myo-inositol-1(or 4)-monophosphatase